VVFPANSSIRDNASVIAAFCFSAVAVKLPPSSTSLEVNLLLKSVVSDFNYASEAETPPIIAALRALSAII